MHFLECPECCCPMYEEPDEAFLTYMCPKCRRIYLYEEGTLVDMGVAETRPPTSPQA